MLRRKLIWSMATPRWSLWRRIPLYCSQPSRRCLWQARPQRSFTWQCHHLLTLWRSQQLPCIRYKTAPQTPTFTNTKLSHPTNRERTKCHSHWVTCINPMAWLTEHSNIAIQSRLLRKSWQIVWSHPSKSSTLCRPEKIRMPRSTHLPRVSLWSISSWPRQ